jgi:hypothetical protein
MKKYFFIWFGFLVLAHLLAKWAKWRVRNRPNRSGDSWLGGFIVIGLWLTLFVALLWVAHALAWGFNISPNPETFDWSEVPMGWQDVDRENQDDIDIFMDYFRWYINEWAGERPFAKGVFKMLAAWAWCVFLSCGVMTGLAYDIDKQQTAVLGGATIISLVLAIVFQIGVTTFIGLIAAIIGIIATVIGIILKFGSLRPNRDH